MARITYKLFANGQHVGAYSVPAAWGAHRRFTRMQRIAAVTARACGTTRTNVHFYMCR